MTEGTQRFVEFWHAWWAPADNLNDRLYVSDYYTGAIKYRTREEARLAALDETGDGYVVGIERVHYLESRESETFDG